MLYFEEKQKLKNLIKLLVFTAILSIANLASAATWVYNVPYSLDTDHIQDTLYNLAKKGDLYNGVFKERPHIKVDFTAYPKEKYYKLQVKTLSTTIPRLSYMYKSVEIWQVENNMLRIRAKCTLVASWNRLNFPFRWLNCIIGRVVDRIENKIENIILYKEQKLLNKLLNTK